MPAVCRSILLVLCLLPLLLAQDSSGELDIIRCRDNSDCPSTAGLCQFDCPRGLTCLASTLVTDSYSQCVSAGKYCQQTGCCSFLLEPQRRILGAGTIGSGVFVVVQLTDCGGAPVSNLEPEDFAIQEDEIAVQPGVLPAAVQSSPPGQMATLLVLDMTSMAGMELERLVVATQVFATWGPPGHLVSLAAFDGSSSLHTLVPWTTQQMRLQRGADNLYEFRPIKYRTNLHGAIVAALENVTAVAPPIKSVVLCTNGKDTAGMVSAQAALAAAQRSGVIFYTVALGDHADDGLLSSLAVKPSRFFALQDTTSLEETFRAISASLTLIGRSIYKVSYCSGLRGGMHSAVFSFLDPVLRGAGALPSQDQPPAAATPLATTTSPPTTQPSTTVPATTRAATTVAATVRPTTAVPVTSVPPGPTAPATPPASTPPGRTPTPTVPATQPPATPAPTPRPPATQPPNPVTTVHSNGNSTAGKRQRAAVPPSSGIYRRFFTTPLDAGAFDGTCDLQFLRSPCEGRALIPTGTGGLMCAPGSAAANLQPLLGPLITAVTLLLVIALQQ